MEVKLGYKQTEVGIIPAEWEVGPLSSLISYGPRNGYSGRSGKDARGTPTLALTATTSGRMILDEETVKHLEETLEDNSDILLKAGDVLVQRSNTLELVGTTAIFDGPSGVYAYPDLMMRMRFKVPETSHWFWRYANSSSGRRYFVSVAAGSTGTMPKLSGDKLRTMPLPLPPLLEQRAIAKALSDVDGLLGGLDQLIAKKRDLKQAAMQQLLTGQTRLPGFHGDWEVKAIGDSIDLLTGFPFPSAEYCDVGVRLLRGSNVKRGVTDWSDDLVQCWPRMTPDIARYELSEGDVVIAMDGSLVGRSYARLQTQDLPAVLLQRVARIRSATLDIGYLTQFVGSDIFIGYCNSVKTVTAIPHISPSDIRNFRIPIPPDIDEQTAIAEVLTEMDAELAALEQRREKTRALKQAMMQELLTGRTRLK